MRGRSARPTNFLANRDVLIRCGLAWRCDEAAYAALLAHSSVREAVLLWRALVKFSGAAEGHHVGRDVRVECGVWAKSAADDFCFVATASEIATQIPRSAAAA